MHPGIRKRSDENLTDSAIESVISGLNSETPITKKTACAVLSIAYNTTRLGKIIEDYIERKEFAATRRKQLRNTPLDKVDTKYIVEAYMDSQPLQGIADTIFRSVAVVKRTLENYNIPLRTPSATYYNPIDLKLTSVSDTYVKGDLVYSARYDVPAIIVKLYRPGIYRVWLHKVCQYAYQPAYELGDLREVQKSLNIKIEEMSGDEINHLIMEARRNAKKRDK